MRSNHSVSRLPVATAATWLVLASAALWQFPTASFGFPIGAGSCNAGTDALLQTGVADLSLQVHGLLMQVGTGPLVDYGLALELDGTVLDPSVPSSFVFGEEHLLTLKSNGNDEFTGFLVRLGATDGSRTLDSLLPISGENDVNGSPLVRLADSCRSVNLVGGVTQQNALAKSAVNMTLFMESTSSNLELDVTVVIKTNVQANISQWYYNRYILNAVDPTGTTPSPVEPESPVPAPTTSPEQETNTTVLPTGAPAMAPSGSGGFNHYSHGLLIAGMMTLVVTTIVVEALWLL
jgi:hypothetical protein